MHESAYLLQVCQPFLVNRDRFTMQDIELKIQLRQNGHEETFSWKLVGITLLDCWIHYFIISYTYWSQTFLV